MKTITANFKKGFYAEYDQISIENIVYEQNDDGLLLECELINADGIQHKEIAVNFSEWNNLLGNITDPIISLRLQDILSERVFNSDEFIVQINLPEVLGTSVLISDYDFQHSYYELCA